MAVITTPSATSAASVVASKLAGTVVAISAGLRILTARLVMAAMTAEAGAVLGALLAVHLVIQVAGIPAEALLILMRQWRRQPRLTRLTGHVRRRTGTTGLDERCSRCTRPFDVAV